MLPDWWATSAAAMAEQAEPALVAWLNKVFDKSFVTRDEDVASLLKHLLAEGT